MMVNADILSSTAHIGGHCFNMLNADFRRFRHSDGHPIHCGKNKCEGWFNVCENRIWVAMRQHKAGDAIAICTQPTVFTRFKNYIQNEWS